VLINAACHFIARDLTSDVLLPSPGSEWLSRPLLSLLWQQEKCRPSSPAGLAPREASLGSGKYVITAVPPMRTFLLVACETEKTEGKERNFLPVLTQETCKYFQKTFCIKAVSGQELQEEWRATATYKQCGSLQLQQLCFLARHHISSVKHRIIESLRLEKTSKIIKSNRQPNTTMPAKPFLRSDCSCPALPSRDRIFA